MASVASSETMNLHPNFSKTMELRWAKRPNTRKPHRLQFPPPLTAPSSIPVYISAKPGHVDPTALRDLYASCNLSCHRDVGPGRRIRGDDAVGLDKLRIALAHSSVVVSVFCRDEDVSSGAKRDAAVGIGGLVNKMLPRFDPSDGRLVGFGRAVSDMGLTASIYDVMNLLMEARRLMEPLGLPLGCCAYMPVVIPSLRGMGIGQMIVQRIVRILTSRDIYDIAALCLENERPLFEACGFKDDILGSTTMMYTRSVSDDYGVAGPNT